MLLASFVGIGLIKNVRNMEKVSVLTPLGFAILKAMYMVCLLDSSEYELNEESKEKEKI